MSAKIVNIEEDSRFQNNLIKSVSGKPRTPGPIQPLDRKTQEVPHTQAATFKPSGTTVHLSTPPIRPNFDNLLKNIYSKFLSVAIRVLPVAFSIVFLLTF